MYWFVLCLILPPSCHGLPFYCPYYVLDQNTFHWLVSLILIVDLAHPYQARLRRDVEISVLSGHVRFNKLLSRGYTLARWSAESGLVLINFSSTRPLLTRPGLLISPGHAGNPGKLSELRGGWVSPLRGPPGQLH